MSKQYSEISRRITQTLIVLFYALTVLTHLLILGGIIPFEWVNGGMSPSYSAQAVQSVATLMVVGLLFLVVWKVCRQNVYPSTWRRWLVYAVTALWGLGFVMQLLGTPFERYVLSVLLLLGVAGHALLIRQFRLLRKSGSVK